MARNVTDLRIGNTRGVLQELMRNGSASRAELARNLHVSKPTIGSITADLLERGLISEVDLGVSGSGMRGRPSTSLQLDRRYKRFLLVQIGVNEIRLAPMPLHVDDTDAWSVSLPTPNAASALKKTLVNAFRQLQTGDLLGMVVSVPGLVDEQTGRSIFSPNLRWLADSNLVKTAQSVLALPVILMQEIRALALGHHLQRGADNFLLVDVDQGLGGAAVIDGKLYNAPLPIAMEIGHAQIVGETQSCGCGGTGCLETLFSVGGMRRTWNKHHRPGFRKWGNLADHLANHPDIDLGWIEPTLDAAGSVIGSALNTIGVKRVVFTGAVNDLPEHFQRMLSECVARHSLWGRLEDIACDFSPRYRMRGMVATGIDRLVAPLPDSVVHQVAS